MHDTDSYTQLETLEREVQRTRPRTRIGLVAAVVAAAAVIAALVVVDASRDDGSSTPAGPVDAAAATELASDFMAALTAYDGDRAATYLADGAGIQLTTSTLDAESMGPHVRWTRAMGFRLLLGSCEPESSAAPATVVACAYDVHGLGSERLGRGPFTDNVLRLTVADGEIVSGVEEWGSDAFEVTMWEPFVAWLLSNHVYESDFMFADRPGAMRPALTERSARLWAKNVDRYVEAVERGKAP